MRLECFRMEVHVLYSPAANQSQHCRTVTSLQAGLHPFLMIKQLMNALVKLMTENKHAEDFKHNTADNV